MGGRNPKARFPSACGFSAARGAPNVWPGSGRASRFFLRITCSLLKQKTFEWRCCYSSLILKDFQEIQSLHVIDSKWFSGKFRGFPGNEKGAA